MDKLVINGGNPLSGSVTISGAKNAVLPLMAASLLVDGKTTLSRVPNYSADDLGQSEVAGRENS